LPFQFNFQILDSVNSIDKNILRLTSVNALQLHSLVLRNTLVKPAEHLIDNQDIDPDTNFYDTLSKGSNSYIDAGAYNNFFKPDDKDALHAIHINCRSISTNCLLVKILLDTLLVVPSIVAVTETWLNSASEDAIIFSLNAV